MLVFSKLLGFRLGALTSIIGIIFYTPPLGADFPGIDALQHNTAMRNVSVVLLAESGFAPLNPPELLSHLQPHLAVLNVAAGNESGLPSPKTVQALEGYNLLRIDQNGWIEISTDGRQMWVEVERKESKKPVGRPKQADGAI